MINSAQDIRKDINGLRAIAVIAVTLYHIAHVLFPENHYFQGGFLGVDIFFVISGFLMTKIIMSGLNNNNFNLLVFYKKRAKRICPALFTIIVVFLLVAVVIFDNTTLKEAFRDALRSLGFISNMWYASKNGYFDADVSSSLFLHTWSLSVEWQFYLIYPLLLMLLSRFLSHRYIGYVVAVLAACSFIFAGYLLQVNPHGAYYYLPSRAYELLIGGLAFFYPINKTFKLNQNKARFLEGIGLILILLSFLFIDASNGWPSSWSLVPLLGTYLCIVANNQSSFLSNLVLQKLGLWSYAIYLVHWPVIVLFRDYIPFVSWESVFIILPLGIALHYAIECRRNFGWKFLIIYLLLGASTQCFIRNVNKIFPTPEILYGVKSEFNDAIPAHIGNQNRSIDFILTGDSLSRQYVQAIKDRNLHVVLLGLDGCFSSANIYSKRDADDVFNKQCSLKYGYLLKIAKENPDVPIVWTQNWDQYQTRKFVSSKFDENVKFADAFKSDINQFISDFANNQRKLYFIGTVRNNSKYYDSTLGIKCFSFQYKPALWSSFLWNAFDCGSRFNFEPRSFDLLIKESIAVYYQNPSKPIGQNDVNYIDINNRFCNNEGCLILDEESKYPIFFDKNHFSVQGALIALDYILQQMNIEVNK